MTTAVGTPGPRRGARRPYLGLGYEQANAIGFLLPTMVVLMGVAVFPIVYSFWISLFDIKLTRPHRTPFVGLDNYIELLADDKFWTSVARTTSFTIMAVVAVSVLALLFALLLDQQFRGRRLVSTILLVPWAIPYVANALMWKWNTKIRNKGRDQKGLWH